MGVKWRPRKIEINRTSRKVRMRAASQAPKSPAPIIFGDCAQDECHERCEGSRGENLDQRSRVTDQGGVESDGRTLFAQHADHTACAVLHSGRDGLPSGHCVEFMPLFVKRQKYELPMLCFDFF